ncbi:hypothetical protein OHA25_37795 [Nonomuraea sp. NBC_00507]|uniref:hypothetical protein n=1 Tax=Nonomuraea sp. NBC_00507 TaxID=2976002 RepID=UPI002E174D49
MPAAVEVAARVAEKAGTLAGLDREAAFCELSDAPFAEHRGDDPIQVVLVSAAVQR